VPKLFAQIARRIGIKELVDGSDQTIPKLR